MTAAPPAATSGSAGSSAPPALSEPTIRVRPAWIAGFGLAWFGIWMAQLAPFQLLLPAQVEALDPGADWRDAVLAFGAVSGIAGLFAVVAFPITGALSDRTTSRFGRRRPWIAGGTLLFAVALVALGAQDSFAGIAVCWTLAIIGFCVLSAGLTATISDQVPVRQRGVVSAAMSAPQAIGTIVGLLLVTEVVNGVLAGYAAVAALLIVFVLPFLLRAPDAVLARDQRPPLTLRSIVAGLWISPRRHPDFAWVLTGRILVNVGNALGTGLLLYFLQFGLGLDDAEDALILLSLVYLAFVVLSSVVVGRVSDRIGRRRPFVIVSSVLVAFAALLLALVPAFEAALVGGALLGLGYGCFLAVDQALATQVLPDAADRGKDLGIMNIGTAVPQAVAPLLGAVLVAALGGFTGLFLAAGVAALLGALAVLPVRSVR